MAFQKGAFQDTSDGTKAFQVQTVFDTSLVFAVGVDVTPTNVNAYSVSITETIGLDVASFRITPYTISLTLQEPGAGRDTLILQIHEQQTLVVTVR